MQAASQTVLVPRQQSAFHWKALIITGIIQIITGTISVALGIPHVAIEHIYGFHFAGTSIWSGILFFLVAGILGILSGGKKSSHLAVSYLVVSIFAGFASVTVLGISCADITVFSHYPYIQLQTPAQIGLDAALIVVSIAELVTAVVGIFMAGCAIYTKTKKHQTMAQQQMALPDGIHTQF